MEQPAKATFPATITLMLEVVPENLQDADPALVDAVGRDTVAALRQDGATVAPVYSGQKGGFLVLVTTAATFLWANKDIVIADVSGLVTILTSAVLPLMNKLRRAYEERVGKKVAEQRPIIFTLQIEGKPVFVEVADLESAEAILQLAQHIQANNPDLTGKIPQSKLKASVPKKPERRRR